jgi:hypothetical protein
MHDVDVQAGEIDAVPGAERRVIAIRADAQWCPRRRPRRAGR